jgi:hypothetical protein
MADKKVSAFWIKHLVLAFIVLACALVVLLYAPEDSDGSGMGGADSKENIADILARFYEEFRLSSKDPIQEQYGDYVIALETPEASQTEQLIAISTVNSPPEENWQGQYKFRSFAQGTTIRTEAMKYAEQEGMQLIWDLNQDFIIRHRFLSENSLVATLDEIAGAIDANFIPQVNVYFCNKKRTIVIAENAGTYVIDNCKKAGFD